MAGIHRLRRIKSIAFGVSGGLIAGTYLSLVTLLANLFPPFASPLIVLLESILPWYGCSYAVLPIAFGWGFLHAFFSLWLLGETYNLFTQPEWRCFALGKRVRLYWLYWFQNVYKED